MRQRFDDKDGKVIFFEVDEVLSVGYPKGTLKVELIVYPVGGGKYSSFIYTNKSVFALENSFSSLAERLLTDEKKSYGVKEISEMLSIFIDPNPIYPQKINP